VFLRVKWPNQQCQSTEGLLANCSLNNSKQVTKSYNCTSLQMTQWQQVRVWFSSYYHILPLNNMYMYKHKHYFGIFVRFLVPPVSVSTYFPNEDFNNWSQCTKMSSDRESYYNWPGLADLNRADLNQWFKSNDFFVKKIMWFKSWFKKLKNSKRKQVTLNSFIN